MKIIPGIGGPAPDPRNQAPAAAAPIMANRPRQIYLSIGWRQHQRLARKINQNDYQSPAKTSEKK